MSRFTAALADRETDPGSRRWIFVTYDQLSAEIGPLSEEDPLELGIVMVENPDKASRRPYHRQKLALILANGRHFALEQAELGVAVRWVVANRGYRDCLSSLVNELGPMRCMRPAEYEMRRELEPLLTSGALVEISHNGWLSTDEDFTESQKDSPPWRMDAFYRQVRRRTGILMEEGKPVAGKFSFDADNRKPWSGEPWSPEPPKFTPDDITIEVAELIENRFADHPGELNLSALPATAADAATVWRWARDECMEYFGPFEDAMSRKSEGLFHTRISSLLNIHRLLPARVVEDVAAMEIPLASKEGFIRQVLGWREFVRHVHERTDGFRRVNGHEGAVADSPGDAGWGRWRGQSWQGSITPSVDGGADPSSFGGRRQLPLGFWPGRPTGLACLDRVVGEVWSNAWTHHIPRLMVLGNIAALLDVSPRQLTDWFWVAFVDAFDWVVEPNVLAMGSYGVGPVMTTKPYVSGAAYINRMSDYCGECEFDPKTTCPITNLYWAFLHRHRDRLRDNPRMRLIMSTAAKRAPEQRVLDEAVFKWMVSVLDRGEYLKPEDRPEV